MQYLKAAYIAVFTRITDARGKVMKFKDSPSSWLLEEDNDDVLCRVKGGEDETELCVAWEYAKATEWVTVQLEIVFRELAEHHHCELP
jgi:hypothetical protein